MFHVKPRAEKMLVDPDALETLRFLAELAEPVQDHRLEAEHRKLIEDSGEIPRQ